MKLISPSSITSPLPDLRTLPLLPPEIVQLIVEAALPRLSFHTFKDRYYTLLKLALVNKVWSRIAGRELLRHVWLPGRYRIQLFLALQGPANGVGSPTWSLRFNEHTPEVLRSLFAILPDLRVVHTMVETGAPSQIHLDTFSTLRNLEELAIDYSRITRPLYNDPVNLPTLTKLALSSLSTPRNFGSVLASAHLPRLESLVLIFGEALDPQDLNDLTSALLPLAPKLKSFTLSFAESDMWFAFPAEIWTSMSALQSLALDHDYDISQVLPHLPSTLARFHIRPPLHSFTPLTFTPLHNALIASPPCLKTLRQIIIPPPPPLNVPRFRPANAEARQQVEARRSAIIEECRRRGIEVVERPSFRADQSVEAVEDALDRN
ncbi:hypothetical protein BCR35DRAFT_298093 [Leucosporidium creatinivorum]|uniref:F-box domain-containing protein n=1 Tax=Leucosporidium creatinivorum TaxID=106004 RepID=A0A1Y2G5J8_9BASI|nr:hypothetical protein BCR35DRAFT_298093 [Leucosporidium creatinivorum]